MNDHRRASTTPARAEQGRATDAVRGVLRPGDGNLTVDEVSKRAGICREEAFRQLGILKAEGGAVQVAGGRWRAA